MAGSLDPMGNHADVGGNLIKFLKALISFKEARLRAEWYRNEIIQALEDGDYERVARLETERDRC